MPKKLNLSIVCYSTRQSKSTGMSKIFEVGSNSLHDIKVVYHRYIFLPFMFNGERYSSWTMSPIATKIYMMIAYYMV